MFHQRLPHQVVIFEVVAEHTRSSSKDDLMSVDLTIDMSTPVVIDLYLDVGELG